MKKEVTWIIFLIIVLSSTINILTTSAITATKSTITGETITGRASSAGTNVSIFISAAIPSLEIINPDNRTYITNESLLLYYTATNAVEVWYNLDDEDNITITSWVYFNASEGSHTLWLYANSSTGNLTSANVTFFIDSTMFTVNYSEWENMAEMNYTNFNEYSYEEMENMTNFYLEHTDFGKFLFYGAINFTDDENPEDGIINIAEYMNVSFNRIFLNSTALPNFNTSATLQIHGLTFTNPRLVMDGEVCPSTICTQNSYLSGVLSFNVTHFTEYEAEETPVQASPPGGGGGGGGGGSGAAITDFSIDKQQIKTSLKQGETEKESLIIKNTGTQRLSMKIESNLEDFMKISETSFSLNSGETKNIILDFIAREEKIPDLYLGKIIIKEGAKIKEILVSVEVESKNPLFDAKIEIPEKFLRIMPGEDIIAAVTLYSLGKTGRVDVKVEYLIKDETGRAITTEEETLAVETQASFIKTFKIPGNAEYGNYIIYLKATYNGESASASTWFIVGKTVFLKTEYILITAIIAIALIILLVILYEIKRIKKHMKIDEKSLIKEKLIKIRRYIRKR